MQSRTASSTRKTNETEISLAINLDGQGKANIHTGVDFFDHMLDSFTRHGLFDLDVQVNGDLQVDCHHTVEDVGIVLGEAISMALGNKKGISRYGYFLLPMDETLALCAIDLSGRPFLKYHAIFTTENVGGMKTEMFKEFFYALSYSGAMNLHLKVIDGENNHHIAEALFKAFGRALKDAVKEEPRINEVWSTKGSL